MGDMGSLGDGFESDLWTYKVGLRNPDWSSELRVTQGCNSRAYTMELSGVFY